MQGGIVMGGVLAASVSGTTMSEKLTAVNQMDHTAFAELVWTDGFLKALVPGDLIEIPAGYIVLAILTDKANGTSFLRWGILPGAQKQATGAMLNDMLQAFKVLQSTDYKAFAKYFS